MKVRLLVAVLVIFALLALTVSPLPAQDAPAKSAPKTALPDTTPSKPQRREEYFQAQFRDIFSAYKKGALDLLKGEKLICGATLLPDGYALTSCAALEDEDAQGLKLRAAGGATVAAELVCRHFTYDIALLKLKGKLEGAQALEFGDESNLKKGQFVFTLAPEEKRSRASIFSRVPRNIGMVSEQARKRLKLFGALSDDFPLPPRAYVRVLQHDGYVYADMRGLPLVDKTGCLLGVNLGLVLRGLSVVTPVCVMREVLPRMKRNKVLADYPHFGFSGESMEKEEAPETLTRYLRDHKVKKGCGVKVTRVYEGSPAGDCGLKEGDVVIYVGVEPIPDLDTLAKVHSSLLPHMRVRLTVFREEERLYPRLKVAKRPAKELTLTLKKGASEEDAGKALEETKTVLMAQPLRVEKNGERFILHIKSPVPGWALKDHLRYSKTALKSAQ